MVNLLRDEYNAARSLAPENSGEEYNALGRPTYRGESITDQKELIELYLKEYSQIKDFPRRSKETIREWQFQRIKELVSHAYDTVSYYHQKYKNAGFRPADLNSWEDFERIPFLTKEELIAGWPSEVIARGYDTEFTTRSSGSSGKFVTIAVDKKSVMIDTIMGCRQLEYQSSNRITPRDTTLYIYTCPWWFGSVGGLYPSTFLPTNEPIKRIAEVIKAVKPSIISLYPSYLRQLHKLLGNIRELGTKVVIVHSEQSTKLEREKISENLGVPVLDEYSSEELTRIALECPYANYHLEEDACYIEIVNPETGRNLSEGKLGEVVGTNLLNEATPLIRYKQGDLASLVNGTPNCLCGSNFRQLYEIKGRKADCLITPKGKIIPSGTLMDLAYRWFLDLGIPIHGLQYEIIQKRSDYVEINLVNNKAIKNEDLLSIKRQLKDIFDYETTVEILFVNNIKQRKGKFRPIRREI